MKNKKHYVFPFVYGAALLLFTVYVLLDAFVIPRSYTVIGADTTQTDTTAAVSGSVTTGNSASGTVTTANTGASTTADATAKSEPVVSATSYDDGLVNIEIKTYRENSTTIYAAFITVADGADAADVISTAFANDVYGKNITAATSTIAESKNAVLAINGDYYSARSGYVIRNGVLYRETSAGRAQEDLVIYGDGTFAVISEGDISAKQLLSDGARQVFSFGPGLVSDGAVTVGENSEVDRSMASNPRTAIGMISPGTYVMVVSDGRTTASTGLSLYQLATFMKGLGCTVAYNLDGGGSSAMVFLGKVVNNPTTDGKRIVERKVSDIVYIGA